MDSIQLNMAAIDQVWLLSPPLSVCVCVCVYVCVLCVLCVCVTTVCVHIMSVA